MSFQALLLLISLSAVASAILLPDCSPCIIGVLCRRGGCINGRCNDPGCAPPPPLPPRPLPGPPNPRPLLPIPTFPNPLAPASTAPNPSVTRPPRSQLRECATCIANTDCLSNICTVRGAVGRCTFNTRASRDRCFRPAGRKRGLCQNCRLDTECFSHRCRRGKCIRGLASRRRCFGPSATRAPPTTAPPSNSEGSNPIGTGVLNPPLPPLPPLPPRPLPPLLKPECAPCASGVECVGGSCVLGRCVAGLRLLALKKCKIQGLLGGTGL